MKERRKEERSGKRDEGRLTGGRREKGKGKELLLTDIIAVHI